MALAKLQAKLPDIADRRASAEALGDAAVIEARLATLQQARDERFAAAGRLRDVALPIFDAAREKRRKQAAAYGIESIATRWGPAFRPEDRGQQNSTSGAARWSRPVRF
jgi:hypothetical protein